ncbi:MAG TPA: vWA domain-containing protein [Chlamydiales bacterium]|nr:vWA domain-containing protein [Chlamydiales bacterium]
MMLELFTAIALIVDRSGSMHSVADDTKGSVQNLIQTQKKEAGRASLTLVQFDHEYDVVYDFVDIQEVDENAFAEQYEPRGSTALVDAIGRTIIEMSQKIDKMEDEAPNKIVVAIVTDGYENASREFTTAKVRNLIEEKQNQGWEFMFLGADINAIQSAQGYGISPDTCAYYDNSKVGSAMDLINAKITDSRAGKQIQITEEERAKIAN